jgi:hypothetical protein
MVAVYMSTYAILRAHVELPEDFLVQAQVFLMRPWSRPLLLFRNPVLFDRCIGYGASFVLLWCALRYFHFDLLLGLIDESSFDSRWLVHNLNDLGDFFLLLLRSASGCRPW